MTEAHSELRKLAEAATPGPWFLDTSNICCGVTQGTSYKDRGVFVTDETTRDDGAFIAAANPKAVLAILDENGRLRAALDEIARTWDIELAREVLTPSDLPSPRPA